ncbi:putative membrane protein [Deinobacterium chartae]|uniref:Putative membrane protein n=1 Tax=Deinobacterium chartae TaxID=521158 RepID=A0A841I1C9_9DEIO|nr:DUF420 domain-containing protein [Deinobacterium chartae]MBB6099611.1 putative membrane protein [Deinobacterium chartae]
MPANANLAELVSFWSIITIVLSGLSLIVGVILIRRGQRTWHMRAMVTATAFAALFLALYITKTLLGASRGYNGPEEWRLAYYILLGSHTILAAANGPMALVVIYNALKGRGASGGSLAPTATRSGAAGSFFARHRAWARWTVPVWLYVAVTGWIIYLVLHAYPPKYIEL